MQSSQATEHNNPLSTALAEIVEVDREVDRLEAEIKTLKKRREALEAVAVEEMTEGRLDGVRVAGRSWRVEWDHYCSVATDRQDALMEVAKAGGWVDSLVSVSTVRLKSLLRELAKAAGKDARSPYTAGTAFEGLVSEHVAPKLRHVTVA